LADAEGFARVTAAEADLQERVRRNRAAEREVGAAWEEVAAAQEAYRGMFYRYQYLEVRAGERSQLFTWARDIVRGAAERQRPTAERLPRDSQARIASVVQAVNAQRPVDASFERLNLELWLSKLREYLTVDDPAAR